MKTLKTYTTEGGKTFKVSQDNCKVFFKCLNGVFSNWTDTLIRDAANHLDRMFLKDIDRKYNLNINFG